MLYLHFVLDPSHRGAQAITYKWYSNRAPPQAEHYAGEGRAPMVLEMQQGMVDRGASLAWLSQYPVVTLV